jgi:hypothetical protein
MKVADSTMDALSQPQTDRGCSDTLAARARIPDFQRPTKVDHASLACAFRAQLIWIIATARSRAYGCAMAWRRQEMAMAEGSTRSLHDMLDSAGRRAHRQSEAPSPQNDAGVLVSERAVVLNPAATDHLPIFVTAPGHTDVLFNIMIVFLIAVVFGVGLLYLRLHALPEHLAHGASKIQLQIVGALCLLALFTHNNLFWVAALLIALVQFPDFSTPLQSMAQSLESMSGQAPASLADLTPPTADRVLQPTTPVTALPEKAV